MSWHIKKANSSAPVSGEIQRLTSNQRPRVRRPPVTNFVDRPNRRRPPRPKNGVR
jgi:hypothetical protein